jgi:hypothetical protein
VTALKSVAAYRAQHAREPVELPLDDKRSVMFPVPSWGEFADANEASANDIELLCLLAPQEDRADLEAALRGLHPADVLRVATDIYEAMGLGKKEPSPAS